SLTLALRHRLAAAPPSGPVFRALAGGTATLVDTLADRLRERGAGIHTSTAVTGLGATTDGRIAVTVADRPALVADSGVVAAPAARHVGRRAGRRSQPCRRGAPAPHRPRAGRVRDRGPRRLPGHRARGSVRRARPPRRRVARHRGLVRFEEVAALERRGAHRAA